MASLFHFFISIASSTMKTLGHKIIPVKRAAKICCLPACSPAPSNRVELETLTHYTQAFRSPLPLISIRGENVQNLAWIFDPVDFNAFWFRNEAICLKSAKHGVVND